MLEWYLQAIVICYIILLLTFHAWPVTYVSVKVSPTASNCTPFLEKVIAIFENLILLRNSSFSRRCIPWKSTEISWQISQPVLKNFPVHKIIIGQFCIFQNPGSCMTITVSVTQAGIDDLFRNLSDVCLWFLFFSPFFFEDFLRYFEIFGDVYKLILGFFLIFWDFAPTLVFHFH